MQACHHEDDAIGILPWQDFQYTATESKRIGEDEDQLQLKETCHALECIGLDSEARSEIFSLLKVILMIGMLFLDLGPNRAEATSNSRKASKMRRLTLP